MASSLLWCAHGFVQTIAMEMHAWKSETFQAIKLDMNAVRENNGEFRDMIFRDLNEGLPEMQAQNSFMPLEDLRQELDKIDLGQVGNYFASYLPKPEELNKE